MNTLRRSLLPALFLLALVGHAQVREKMGFPLKAFLKQAHSPDTEVDVFIHGPKEEVAVAVLAHGGRVKLSREGLISARIPVGRLQALAAEPAVGFFEFSLDKGYALNDSMRVKNRINEIHAGLAPLPDGYTGDGVIMGIIDSGMDFQHPDMQHADGRTRILKYWDQTLPYNAASTPEPYGYGQVWDSTQINQGLMTSVDQPGYYGHGTSVSSIAAGNGLANGRHKGVAPDADYIVVSSRFNAPNWRSVVADGVQYIFDQAEAMGRPAVINASLGTYFGSHDGLDAAALFIDDLLLEQGGRAMVCAAGNSNELAPYHLRTMVDSDTSWTWFRRNANSLLGYPAVYFELWADVEDFQNVEFAVGADRNSTLRFRGRTPFHTVADALGTVVTDTLWSLSGNRLGIVDLYAIQRGDQYQLQVHMQEPDSVTYRFRFMTTGSGMFDIWSSSNFGYSTMDAVAPSVAQVPTAIHYVVPDRNQHIVDSWACSPHVMTVANYQNETSYIDYVGNPQTVAGVEDSIAGPSSSGPARNGLMKPEIASTGSIIFAAPPLVDLQASIANGGTTVDAGGWHIRGGGTSAASPVVAGTMALYFEKCPNATADEVKQAILATAVTDAFTGTVPNDRWGLGKLDAFAALSLSNPPTALLVDGPIPFCEGEQVQVSAAEGMASYVWSNGATTPSIVVGSVEQVSVWMTSVSGCVGGSDTLQLSTIPTPAVPVIGQDATLLTSSPAFSYQWYLNGEPIDGAIEQSYDAVTGGSYHVVVTNEFDCSAASEAIVIIITDVDGPGAVRPAIWPSPASDVLMLRVPPGGVRRNNALVIDDLGRVVARFPLGQSSEHVLSLDGLAPGAYTLRVLGDGPEWNGRFIKQR